MAATVGTSWFSAPLIYKSGPNVQIGLADKLMEFTLHFEIKIAEFLWHLFIDCGKIVHCGMAATVET